MKIQSLSIVVPTKGCINTCKFCVSRMHKNIYKDRISDENDSWAEPDYLKRLEFARDNNCNTVILTGWGEPQQNMEFIKYFSKLNQGLPNPFKSIELQTTGANITKQDVVALKDYGVTTISLSISCLDDEDVNSEIINGGTNKIGIKELAKIIKEFNINLRLSLNVTDLLVTLPDKEYEEPVVIYRESIEKIFDICSELEANQVTFRQMYTTNSETPQAKWVKEHTVDEEWFDVLRRFAERVGHYLDTLEYGAKRYSIKEMSVVIDDDCMAKNTSKDRGFKYLILRPDCKLYTQWDDKGSLIF